MRISGTQLRLIRRRRGCTQRQLAQRLGLGESTLGMYEQGRRNPSRKTVQRLCEVLQISPECLSASTLLQGRSEELLNEVAICLEEQKKA